MSEDEEICQNSPICWICKQELNMDKVRDHYHVIVNLEVLHIINAT